MLFRAYLEPQDNVLAWVTASFEDSKASRCFEGKDFVWKSGLQVGYTINNGRPDIGWYLLPPNLSLANAIWTYHIQRPLSLGPGVMPVREANVDFFLRQSPASSRFLHLNWSGEFFGEAHTPVEAPGSLSFFLTHQERRFRFEMRGDPWEFGSFVRTQETLWNTQIFQNVDDHNIGMQLQGAFSKSGEMVRDMNQPLIKGGLRFEDRLRTIQMALVQSTLGRYFHAWSKYTLQSDAANHGHPIQPFIK